MPHPALIPPLFTPDLPGCGGVIRMRDEDFDVEEVSSYEPCGEGEHLYLWIEKRGLAPEFFARTIANKLGISPGAVGAAVCVNSKRPGSWRTMVFMVVRLECESQS